MEILYVAVLSLGAITTVFILTKIIGYRQMSQMSMFDYINGITIGSIAAEMATSLEKIFLQPLTAMIVFGLITFGLSFLCRKFIRVRRFVEGHPLVLFQGGRLYRNNLKTCKMDVTELLEQCRVNGYFDLSKLHTIVLECNGRMSFLPEETNRPLNPMDMGMNPKQTFLVANVILDGKVMEENLRHTGNDIKWLQKQAYAKGAKHLEDVLLATVDSSNTLQIYLKEPAENQKDVLL